MEISIVDSVVRQISVASINRYQKHISPRKGFSCAHRLLYGSESCSQYIKRVIAQEGLRVGLLKSRARFQACKQANQILRTQPDDKKRKRKKPFVNHREQSSSTSSNCNDSSQGCSSCAELSCDIADAGVDCGAADCSPLDCDSLDCGSCGS